MPKILYKKIAWKNPRLKCSSIFIDGRREAYCPAQCGDTMTVGELKEFLNNFVDDDEIFLRNDKGYTYGSITCDSFESGEYGSEGVKLDYELITYEY